MCVFQCHIERQFGDGTMAKGYINRKKIKEILGQLTFKMIKRLFTTTSFDFMLRTKIESRSTQRKISSAIPSLMEVEEYSDLGRNNANEYRNSNAIFITGRFRSGSTLIWNLFRSFKGFTAYYEPLLHESPINRGEGRGYTVDPTHIGVKSYHDEFSRIQGLDKLHSPDWAFKNLYMDDSFFEPKLMEYINTLIMHSQARPVLQFNRADFRLEWLRANYPKAKIVHIFRHPREQWISMIKNDEYIDRDFSWNLRDIRHPFPNTFYLRDWWYDLRDKMSFLDIDLLEHPYQVHYLIWRVSYAFGKHFSDTSICYERLLENFEATIRSLFFALEIEGEVDCNLSSFPIVAKREMRWKEYADEIWYKRLEKNCEKIT